MFRSFDPDELGDRIAATDRRYLSADERGSVISVSDSTGAGMGINAYDEYGMPAAGNIGRYGYAGQAWIGPAKLWHLNARAYSPALGRFLQTDPIGYAGDGPNLYAYVLNDPVNFVDPLGLAWLAVQTCHMAAITVGDEEPAWVPRCRTNWQYVPEFSIVRDVGLVIGAIGHIIGISLPSVGHRYATSNKVCRRPLSGVEMKALLSRFAVPGHGGQRLSSGTYWVWAGNSPGGKVNAVFQRGGLQVINTTTALHIFSGIIQRDIFVSGGHTSIMTQGRGVASGALASERDLLNQFSGPAIFDSLDKAAAKFAESHFKGC